MGLDVSIEARIREKQSGRIVTGSGQSFDGIYAGQCLEICYWRKCYDIRDRLIEIARKHGGRVLEEPDLVFSLPARAFPEIYAFLLKRSLLKLNEEPSAMWDRLQYQAINLENAKQVLNLLRFLKKEITYPDLLISEEKFRTLEEFQAFCASPCGYEWEYFLINSY